jgi:hypothetical protein
MAVFEERILDATRLLSVRDFSFVCALEAMVLGRLWQQLCDATFAMMTATAMWPWTQQAAPTFLPPCAPVFTFIAKYIQYCTVQ